MLRFSIKILCGAPEWPRLPTQRIPIAGQRSVDHCAPINRQRGFCLTMKLIITSIIAAASLSMGAAFAAGAAPAAHLSALEGSVMVNQGKSFVPAKLGVELVAGDRVLVLKSGQATVTFADGCAVVVKPGKLVTVADQSPCASAQADAGPGADIAAGDSVPGYGDPPNRTLITTGAILGVVGVGLGASCLAGEFPCDGNHRSQRSVSP